MAQPDHIDGEGMILASNDNADLAAEPATAAVVPGPGRDRPRHWPLPRWLAIPVVIGIAMTWGGLLSIMLVYLPLGLVFGRRIGELLLWISALTWPGFAALILHTLRARIPPRKKPSRGR